MRPAFFCQLVHILVAHINGTHGRSEEEESPALLSARPHKVLDTRGVQEREGDPEEHECRDANGGREEVGVEGRREVGHVHVVSGRRTHEGRAGEAGVGRGRRPVRRRLGEQRGARARRAAHSEAVVVVVVLDFRRRLLGRGGAVPRDDGRRRVLTGNTVRPALALGKHHFVHDLVQSEPSGANHHDNVAHEAVGRRPRRRLPVRLLTRIIDRNHNDTRKRHRDRRNGHLCQARAEEQQAEKVRVERTRGVDGRNVHGGRQRHRDVPADGREGDEQCERHNLVGERARELAPPRGRVQLVSEHGAKVADELLGARARTPRPTREGEYPQMDGEDERERDVRHEEGKIWLVELEHLGEVVGHLGLDGGRKDDADENDKWPDERARLDRRVRRVRYW